MSTPKYEPPKREPGRVKINKGKFEYTEFNHPRHKIARYVVIGAFVTGCIITICLIINNWWFRDSFNKVPDLTNDMKAAWEFLLPVITLVLGYEFGKDS